SLMAYLMSSPIYDAGGGVSGGMMAANGMVLGYPIVWSNVVTSNGIYFANWSDLIIALWGGVDLTVDPYTGSSAGTLRVVALQDADIALRHAQSFAYGS
nr:phage major capsid protein [Planctomycetota bacterium]